MSTYCGPGTILIILFINSHPICPNVILLLHDIKEEAYAKLIRKIVNFTYNNSFPFQKKSRLKDYMLFPCLCRNKPTLKFHNGHYKMEICLESIRLEWWHQFLRSHTDRKASLSCHHGFCSSSRCQRETNQTRAGADLD